MTDTESLDRVVNRLDDTRTWSLNRALAICIQVFALVIQVPTRPARRASVTTDLAETTEVTGGANTQSPPLGCTGGTHRKMVLSDVPLQGVPRWYLLVTTVHTGPFETGEWKQDSLTVD